MPKKIMQEKKKVLLFLSVLIIFTLIFAGCNWFSNGILNVFDPQAQIRLLSMEYDDEEQTMINIEVASINQVEFVGSGFQFKYYNGNNHIASLDRTVGANFYINPSSTPGTTGDATKIEKIQLYSGAVMSYAKANSAFGSISCDIYLLGDSSGYNQSIKVVTGVAAMGTDSELPKASIKSFPSPASGPPPLTVSFDASASTDNRGIASYAWNFGDGSSGTGPVVSHTYNAIGNYAAQLTVTDYFGNEAYASVSVQVVASEGPTAVISASPTSGNPPLTVAFDASGSSANDDCDCGNKIETYSWNFGDGSIGTGITATHTYNEAGTFTVLLTVTDSNGDIGQDVEIITVGSGEYGAQITTTPSTPTGNIPFTVAFVATGSTVEVPPAIYEWDLDGDGVFDEDTGIFTTHEFSSPGTYLVGLRVTDNASPANVYYAFVTVIANEQD